MKEYCIMPDNPPWWRNYEAVKGDRERYHKHHVIFGNANRRLSDEDGLVIFLTPKQHEDIHRNREYRQYSQEEAQRAWEAVNGSRIDFIARYGKSYL